MLVAQNNTKLEVKIKPPLKTVHEVSDTEDCVNWKMFRNVCLNYYHVVYTWTPEYSCIHLWEDIVMSYSIISAIILFDYC